MTPCKANHLHVRNSSQSPSRIFALSLAFLFSFIGLSPSLHAESISLIANPEQTKVASKALPATNTFTLPLISITGDHPYNPVQDVLTTPANDAPFTAKLEKEQIELRKPVNAAEAIKYNDSYES
ncbi:MAG: hypothetical protein WA705_05890 [Candidatus Ozemobacteraceae bacterium]